MGRPGQRNSAATTVERARHATEAARRRYLAVDPSNRLVASTLEADWNHKLRELTDAQDDYDRAAREGAASLDAAIQARIRALAADLPALWGDPATPMRERKRLIRLLVTDVTLLAGDERTTAHVRLPGGASHSITCPGRFGPGRPTPPRRPPWRSLQSWRPTTPTTRW